MYDWSSVEIGDVIFNFFYICIFFLWDEINYNNLVNMFISVLKGEFML